MSERVDWQENQTGDYCYKNGLICDHNHIDGPIRKFICSGYGGKCINGSKYEYYKEGVSDNEYQRFF